MKVARLNGESLTKEKALNIAQAKDVAEKQVESP